MANENETVTENTEATEVTETSEAPKPTSVFEADKQTLVEMTATPNSNFNNITATVERGTETVTLADGGTSSRERYRASWNGKVGKLAASGKGAIAALLTAARYGTVDDFTFDLESEFFAAAPRSNAEKDPVTAEIKAQLQSADAELVAAQTAEGNAQVAFRNAGKALNAVYEKIGGKALKKWFGGDEAKKLVPALVKLDNSGKNALSDFRSFGLLSDAVFAQLPLGVTQGKVADNLIRDVLSDAISNAGTVLAREGAKMDGDVIRVEDLATGIRAVIDTCGVQTAYETPTDGVNVLRTLLDAGEWEARSRGALRAAVLIEDIAEALDVAKAYVEVSDAVAEGKPVDAKVQEKASKDYSKSILIRRMTAAMQSAQKSAAADKREETVLKAADNAENEKLAAASKLKERSASDVAAQVFNTIKGHPALEAVYRDLGILVRDFVDAQKEAEKKAKGEADAA